MTTRVQRYAVYGPGGDDPLVIDAENWVFALGTALELLEREDWVSRLSCEVHADGTVVAEDRVTGARYLVHRVPYIMPATSDSGLPAAEEPPAEVSEAAEAAGLQSQDATTVH